MYLQFYTILDFKYTTTRYRGLRHNLYERTFFFSVAAAREKGERFEREREEEFKRIKMEKKNTWLRVCLFRYNNQKIYRTTLVWNWNNGDGRRWKLVFTRNSRFTVKARDSTLLLFYSVAGIFVKSRGGQKLFYARVYIYTYILYNNVSMYTRINKQRRLKKKKRFCGKILRNAAAVRV